MNSNDQPTKETTMNLSSSNVKSIKVEASVKIKEAARAIREALEILPATGIDLEHEEVACWVDCIRRVGESYLGNVAWTLEHELDRDEAQA